RRVARRVLDVRAPAGEEVRGVLRVLRERAPAELADLARLEDERRDDAEVRARTAHAPEELGVLLAVRDDDGAVGEDHLDLADVVDRQAVLAAEEADAARG